MRWHLPVLLLALAGCGGGPGCPPLAGCVSALVLEVPASVTAAEACVGGVCTSTIGADRTMVVPLSRRADGETADVTVTVAGTPTPYEGTVPVLRTRPDGAACPAVCVNGTAVLDLTGMRVVPGRG